MRLLYKTSPMESLRKWFYKPKRDDRSLLAQFYFADEALNMIAAELDSFDGRKDPDRCTTLVNQLRHAQDRVLNITSQIMDQVLGPERVARGFRVKFPEDVLQDNLAGQLWFGAECLAAGSSIMNHEEESVAMRPLAKALTRSLETVRALLREQCLRPRNMALSEHDDMLHESLRIFDRLFAEFELCYVSAMVNVKTPHEFEAQQLICVLFSESLGRALKQGLLTQEQVDAYDPALMFAVPRLSIVNGLLVYSNGPLSIDKPPNEMSDMFRPFRALLHKIRSLLWTLDRRELMALERLLCTNEDISILANIQIPDVDTTNELVYPDIGEFASRFYADHANCRDLYTMQQSTEEVILENDYLPDNIEVMTPILDGLRRLGDDVDEPRETPEEPAIPSSSETVEESDNCADTFQESDEKDSRPAKTNRSESSEMASLRNLSTNGLMMFDPLVINAVMEESSRLWPDQNLVTSLNEQVTEIADRLSSIVSNEGDNSLEHNQIHSFSTNDVTTLISNDATDHGFQASRPEQMNSLPSTSNGYLIPNAISQEPVVLASLSHNNSAIFNEEDEDAEIHNARLNNDMPMIMSDNAGSDLVTTNMTLANANLTSLLLPEGEFNQNFLEMDADDDDVKSKERVKFMLGYESDNHEMSPGDSGVSTENTSLDRSPDTDIGKDLEKENVTEQNRVLISLEECAEEVERDVATEENLAVDDNQDVVVNINNTDSSDAQTDSAAYCRSVLERVIEEVSDTRPKSKESVGTRRARLVLREEVERITSLQHWGIEVPEEDYRTLDDALSGLHTLKEEDEKLNEYINSTEFLTESFHRSAYPDTANTSTSQATTSRQRRNRKTSSSKTKKKKSKMWSPGRVILDNRASQNQSSPLKLDLDRFVDESGTSCGVSECADDEEIALALQAQELAARQQARAKFKSSEDLIHRLFVCIAGVADQLQTNFAADLRNILKSVFMMNQTPEKPEVDPEPEQPVVSEPEPDPEPQPEPEPMPPEDRKNETIEYEATEQQVIQNGSSFDSVYSAEEVYADSNSDTANSENDSRLERRNTVNSSTLSENQDNPTTSSDARRKSIDMSNLQSSVSTGDLTEFRDERRTTAVERAPEWVPDIAAPDCMRCSAHFTAFRRRHHCRNCGKVFCASCSSNSMPLPKFGQFKPVRVCDECFAGMAQHYRRGAEPDQRR